MLVFLMSLDIELHAAPHMKGFINVSNISDWHGCSSMDSIHQAKLKSSHLLHNMAFVQSQRNRTVPHDLLHQMEAELQKV